MRDRFENHLVLGNYFGVTMSVKKVRAHTGKRQKQAQKEHADVCGSPANSKLLTPSATSTRTSPCRSSRPRARPTACLADLEATAVVIGGD